MNHGSYEDLYDVGWIGFLQRNLIKNQILSQPTQNNIFQIMEDFNAQYGRAHHRATHNFKMKCSTTKRTSSNPKHSSYFQTAFAVHCYFSDCIKTVSSPLILVGRIQGNLHDAYRIIYDMCHKNWHLGYTATFRANCVSCTQAMSLLGYKEAQALRL